MAAAVFFYAKACVTATLASDQAAAAEDELQQHCSTAGDNNFDRLYLVHLVSSWYIKQQATSYTSNEGKWLCNGKERTFIR